jgi:hypothetical protein
MNLRLIKIMLLMGLFQIVPYIDKIELTSTLISFFVVWLYKLGIYALVFIPNYLEKNKVYYIDKIYTLYKS